MAKNEFRSWVFPGDSGEDEDDMATGYPGGMWGPWGNPYPYPMGPSAHSCLQCQVDFCGADGGGYSPGGGADYGGKKKRK